jgi:hypothetical protein
VHETKAFVIPFPEGSPPAEYVFDSRSDKPFSDDYLRSIGAFNKKTWDFIRRSFAGGVTVTWSVYKDYFLQRINELGKEGWELAEPFEHPVDEHGWLVRPNDRFEFESFEEPGWFGPVQRSGFAGARFLMRRMTFEQPPKATAPSRQPTSLVVAGVEIEQTADGFAVAEIPFPADSVLHLVPIDLDSDAPFSESYLREFGYTDVDEEDCTWEWGITLIWQACRDHFRNRLDDLRAQGWELAEPFEEFDEEGRLVNPEDRFTFDDPEEDVETSAQGDWSVFCGAQFKVRSTASR